MCLLPYLKTGKTPAELFETKIAHGKPVLQKLGIKYQRTLYTLLIAMARKVIQFVLSPAGSTGQSSH
jgi:hypothetical protein